MTDAFVWLLKTENKTEKCYLWIAEKIIEIKWMEEMATKKSLGPARVVNPAVVIPERLIVTPQKWAQKA